MKKFLALALTLALVAACTPRNEVPFNEHDFAHGGPDAPLLNERTMQFMDPDNPHFGIDAMRPISQPEMMDKFQRWDNSRVATRWQEYRGAMFRIQVRLGSTDLREMRVRMIQNAIGMDINATNAEMIGRVADFEMRRVCGRRSHSYVILWDRPSFEVVRPTPYFDFVAYDYGGTVREYGFRCIF